MSTPTMNWTRRPAIDPTRRRRSFWGPGWPLQVVFYGYPVWWLLGFGEFTFLLAAIPMAVILIRKGNVVVPRGFGVWLLFLALVLISFFVLDADAPHSVGGINGGRILTYAYRLVWYAVGTIAMLYVGNHDEDELPTDLIVRALGFMLVVTSIGGLAGVVVPYFSFTSPVEHLLPGALAHNSFVVSLIHPATADIQTVLGFPQPRPRAPFAYANSWGANFSFFLPFFARSWCARGRGWKRVAAVPVLVAGGVGVIYSLNRGLWAVLVLGAVYALVQFVRARGTRAVPLAVGVALVAVLVLALSPVSGVVADRLAHPHSNGRRTELATLTVTSVLQGSPVIGYGNTRNVQGSFASIAGGATSSCEACGVPPLGTQGHAWLVIFSQGVLGLVAFFAFFLVRLSRHVRSRHPTTILALPVLIFFLVETLVYDTLGSPFFTLMLALGLMWRADRQRLRAPADLEVRR